MKKILLGMVDLIGFRKNCGRGCSSREEEITTIIDICGNEHQVSGLDEIRKDRSKEEIALEIEQYNQSNKTKTLDLS